MGFQPLLTHSALMIFFRDTELADSKIQNTRSKITDFMLKIQNILCMHNKIQNPLKIQDTKLSYRKCYVMSS